MALTVFACKSTNKPMNLCNTAISHSPTVIPLDNWKQYMSDEWV